jgi:hypothetical protein
MKNIVRAFVVVLALTGAAASSQISSSANTTTVVASKTSALPTPTCPLNDPNACNIRGGW